MGVSRRSSTERLLLCQVGASRRPIGESKARAVVFPQRQCLTNHSRRTAPPPLNSSVSLQKQGNQTCTSKPYLPQHHFPQFLLFPAALRRHRSLRHRGNKALALTVLRLMTLASAIKKLASCAAVTVTKSSTKTIKSKSSSLQRIRLWSFAAKHLVPRPANKSFKRNAAVQRPLNSSVRRLLVG
jgi:hypothetical protein